jgi:hypothetical protein
MPKRKANGQFVKKSHHSKARRSTSRAMTVARPQVTVIRTSSGGVSHKRKSHRRRRGGGGGGMNLTHLAVAGAGLALLAGSKSPIKAIPDQVSKLPGSKTFGNVAVAGLACLGVDRFVKRNKWLRAAGIVGVVLGAVQVGTQGADFKWVGDEDGFSGDVEGDDDGDGYPDQG